jgi:hypothetical protein
MMNMMNMTSMIGQSGRRMGPPPPPPGTHRGRHGRPPHGNGGTPPPPPPHHMQQNGGMTDLISLMSQFNTQGYFGQASQTVQSLYGF